MPAKALDCDAVVDQAQTQPPHPPLHAAAAVAAGGGAAAAAPRAARPSAKRRLSAMAIPTQLPFVEVWLDRALAEAGDDDLSRVLERLQARAAELDAARTLRSLRAADTAQVCLLEAELAAIRGQASDVERAIEGKGKRLRAAGTASPDDVLASARVDSSEESEAGQPAPMEVDAAPLAPPARRRVRFSSPLVIGPTGARAPARPAAPARAAAPAHDWQPAARALVKGVLRSVDRRAASVFFNPVAGADLAGYMAVCPHPVSFSEILRDLGDDAFEGPAAFYADVDRLLNNSYNYNVLARPAELGRAGLALERAFLEAWAKNTVLAAAAPPRAPRDAPANFEAAIRQRRAARAAAAAAQF